MRIYCLEDNALVAMHLEAIIEDCGHQFVDTAASFADAQAHWQNQDFDLALIDIDLRDGRTGIDAARYVRDKGRLGCFVTGQAELALAHRDLVIAVLTKPLDEGALREVLAVAAQSVPT